MHWIYILKCGEKNDKIYVGETKRLYKRLKEHCEKETGSVTTHFFQPNQIIGLYKVEDDFLLIENHLQSTKGNKVTKASALALENTITEMCMLSLAEKWDNVFGGKYHVGFRPASHPCEDKEFNRPFCKCKMPADIKEFNGKPYWRCSKKNIWSKLQDYATDDLEFVSQYECEPCNFYKDFNLF